MNKLLWGMRLLIAGERKIAIGIVRGMTKSCDGVREEEREEEKSE